MANVKLTELTAYTSPVSTDVLPIVDLVNNQTKKVTVADLLKRFGAGTASAPSFSFSGDIDTGIYSPGANQFAVTTGGTQRLLIDASGNTTIQGDLTVNGTTTTVESNTLSIKDKNIEIAVVSTPTDTTADGGGITLKGASDKTINWVQSTGCWTLNQPTNFNNHVRIDSSGRMGIGTDSPGSYNASADNLVVQNDGGTGSAGITVRAGTGAQSTIYFADGTGTSDAIRGYVQYFHNGDFLRFGTDANERVRIDSSGNLLVGLTSAVGISGTPADLNSTEIGRGYINISRDDTAAADHIQFGKNGSVASSIGTSTTNSLTFKTGTTEKMRITSDGNVGIGVINPSAKLDVIGTGVASQIKSTNNNYALALAGNNCTYDVFLGSTNTNDFVIANETNNGTFAERMRITSDGKIGIGTASADANLHIKGGYPTVHIERDHATNYARLLLDNTADDGGAIDGIGDGVGGLRFSTSDAGTITERFRITSDGKIGVGTNSPTGLLHISGQDTAVKIQTSAGTLSDMTNNTSQRIGFQGGNAEIGLFKDSGGNYSYAIGTYQGSVDIPLVFRTGNRAERMRINSSGRLLVGTTETSVHPDRLIEIGNTTRSGTYQAITTSSSGVGGIIFADTITNDTGGYRGLIQYFHADDAMVLKTSSVEAMRIDSSGNVFMGGTSDANADFVFAKGSRASFYRSVGIGTASPANQFEVVSSGATKANFTHASSNKTSLYLESDDTSARVGSTYYGSGGSFKPLAFLTSGTEKMRIDTSGHVGIGKSPVDTNGYSRALDLTGAAGAAIYLRTNAPSNSTDYGVCGYYGSDMYVGNYASGPLRFLSNSTERMRVASSGNIGIGTTSPYAILGGRSLGIANSGGHVELNFLGSTTSYQGIYFGKGTSGADRLNGYIEYKQNDDFMRFAVNYAERMRINSAGNVNIGTTVDGYSNYADKLTIADSSHCGMTIRSGNTSQGNIYFSDATSGTAEYAGIIQYRHNDDAMAFGVGNGIERLRINSAGNVGINTTVPGVDLEVGGNNDNVAAICVRYSTVPAYLTNSFNGTSGLTTLSNNLRNTSDGSTSWSSFTNAGYTAAAIQLTSSQSSAELRFFTSGTANTVPTERMRIAGDGQLRTLAQQTAFLASSATGAGTSEYLIGGQYSASSPGTGTNSFRVYTNGNVQNTNNSYGSISDVKLKENIVDASSQWDDIKDLRVRNYNFIEGQTHTQIGVVAQEVETVSPGLVFDTPDRDDEGNSLGTVTKSVNYSVLYMKAVKALQEAMNRIETLETKVAALEAG